MTFAPSRPGPTAHLRCGSAWAAPPWTLVYFHSVPYLLAPGVLLYRYAVDRTTNRRGGVGDGDTNHDKDASMPKKKNGSECPARLSTVCMFKSSNPVTCYTGQARGPCVRASFSTKPDRGQSTCHRSFVSSLQDRLDVLHICRLFTICRPPTVALSFLPLDLRHNMRPTTDPADPGHLPRRPGKRKAIGSGSHQRCCASSAQ
jgi:hypothetical protein